VLTPCCPRPLLQVISLVCHLVGERQEVRPFLIAVPSSVLPNWEAELKRWAPSLKASAAAGNGTTRLPAGCRLAQEAQVHAA
jgi:SNF2 family DNA or RNA helicase